MPKWILILSLVLVLLFVTTVGAVISTRKRIRHYFDMPNYVGVVPENMNAAITRQLPRGSSRDDVEWFLASRGIGKDSVSVCEAASNVGRVTCHLATDHHSWELLREDYTVSFDFDAGEKLRNVSVRFAFSGL
jgi:hypothetical protein